MTESIKQLQKGLHDGIPIGLGYLAVSFTFGIMAAGAGLTAPEAVLMSFTNLTSAGQFAGLGIIQAGGALLDIGVYAATFARYFMKSRPDVVLTTANYFETGVDETSGIILKNPDGQMAVMALTMRAKQPKRGVVAGEKGFIEICEYPRAQKATITYTEDGRTEVIEEGRTEEALQYEVRDMQDYVMNHGGQENLRIIRDVMQVLTAVRNQWGMTYPFE